MRNFLIAVLLSISFLSCDNKRVFDSYKTLSQKWVANDTVQFQFKNSDTLKMYNLFINVRNTNDYEYSNLYLIVGLEAPNKNETIDTLAYLMAEPNGKWLGEGFTNKENKLYFKENVRFKETGEYKVSITHAMRKNGNVLGEESLKGITEVGFRIEKTEE